jgi:hypothetical protein
MQLKLKLQQFSICFVKMLENVDLEMGFAMVHPSNCEPFI